MIDMGATIIGIPNISKYLNEERPIIRTNHLIKYKGLRRALFLTVPGQVQPADILLYSKNDITLSITD